MNKYEVIKQQQNLYIVVNFCITVVVLKE